MTYVKTVWEDRLVENPNNYTVTNNGDGTSSIIEAPGVVYVGGTPINAANLNKLEDAVSDIYDSVDNLKLGGLNLLDNSNFDMGYYNKYPISNASTTLLTSGTMNFLRVSKLSVSSSSITFNIPAAIADEFRPTEDFTLTLRYASTATVIIEDTPNVIIVDGPKTLTPTTEPKVETVKMKFANTTSLKSIVFKIEGLATQSIDIDWLCVTPGISGGYWIPSKNDLTTYSNELQVSSAVNFNAFTRVGKFLIPQSAASLTNQPTDFVLGKTAFLDVVGGDILGGSGKLIQRLQQFENNKVWYRSVDGYNFGSWNVSSLPIATQAQAQVGTDNNTLMTPVRTKQAIESLTQKIAPMPNNSFNNLSLPSSYPLGESLFFSNGLTGTEMFANYSFATIITQIGFISGIVTNGIQYAIPYRPYSEGSVVKYRIVQLNTPNPQTSTWGPWKVLSYDIATTTEAKTGTNDNNVMTPLKTKQAIDNSPIPRYGTATGTNALTITANPLFDNLYTGLTVKFKNTTANTGNVTANVNAKGAKSILNNDGTQIQSGKLKANAMYEITYDGTNFYLTKGGGESSPIKRVQRGTTSFNTTEISKNVTISSINVGKSIVKFSKRNQTDVSGTSSQNHILAKIVDSTTISFERVDTGNLGIDIEYEVIEFEDNVKVLSGTKVLDGTTVSETISTVDASKSMVYLSYKTTANGEYSQDVSVSLSSNGSVLTFRKANENGTSTINWFVVEMK